MTLNSSHQAHTHWQIPLDEAEENVSADENARASDAGAAVHRDRALVVHGPQVADEADQLLRRVRDAVVGPVRELQVVDKVSPARLRSQLV